MRTMGIREWYEFYTSLLFLLGIHKWVKVKYRKKDRMLIAWEECCICKKVKDSWSGRDREKSSRKRIKTLTLFSFPSPNRPREEDIRNWAATDHNARIVVFFSLTGPIEKDPPNNSTSPTILKCNTVCVPFALERCWPKYSLPSSTPVRICGLIQISDSGVAASTSRNGENIVQWI